MTSQQKETWSVTVLRDHLSEAMMLVLRPRLDRKSSHWAWQVTLHTVYQSESTHKHCNKVVQDWMELQLLFKNTNCHVQLSRNLLKSPKHQMIKTFLCSTSKIILSVYVVLQK